MGSATWSSSSWKILAIHESEVCLGGVKSPRVLVHNDLCRCQFRARYFRMNHVIARREGSIHLGLVYPDVSGAEGPGIRWMLPPWRPHRLICGAETAERDAVACGLAEDTAVELDTAWPMSSNRPRTAECWRLDAETRASSGTRGGHPPNPARNDRATRRAEDLRFQIFTVVPLVSGCRITQKLAHILASSGRHIAAAEAQVNKFLLIWRI